MTYQYTRREVLATGLGAAGLIMTGGVRTFGDEPKQVPLEIPDRSKEAPTAPVAIQRCRTYDPQPLRRELDAALKLIGGIKDLVSNKTVTIKINVTGGPGTLKGLPGYRTYHIHPNLLAALCGAIHDAGARQIVVVEGQYSLKTPEEVLGGADWDIAAIKSAGGNQVLFEDTRNRGKWPKYSRLKVPWGGFLYPAFDVNQRYEKTDVMVSLSKLKDHLSTGITCSIKNLFGITPTSLYAQDAPNEDTIGYRGAILHNATRAVPEGLPAECNTKVPKDWKYRVARVTADCLGARPVDLAIVDGIETNRGGEGPWANGVEPLAPGLLLAGRNAVCTDAICAAAMGYDPLAGHFQFPFPGENHLLLLAQAGVGAIDPKSIEVRGLTLEKAVFPFNPKRIPLEIPTAYLRHYHTGWQQA
jgi:uncharacterized protein (DUF362 family)